MWEGYLTPNRALPYMSLERTRRVKGQAMPKVGKKSFPYSSKGKAAAKKYGKKRSKKVMHK